MADLIGQQLGRYHLVRLIGQGGFADVYLGEHIHLNTQAAIKVLQMRLVGSNMEQFSTEARTIASLVHPNIIRVLDFGVENSIPFLIMDYAPNGTLRQRHPKGIVLPPAQIIPYVRQVASALQYAHDRKFIHRDVKPENMLLGRSSEVLLSDFGLVLIAQSTGSRSIQEMSGTIAYMAPEQLDGRPHSASDQYSLGIIVYEWLTGDRPFNGAFVEIASQHILTPPAPLHEKVPAISPAIEEVVLTALAKNPQQRFASIQAFATALEQATLSTHPALSGPPYVVQAGQTSLPTPVVARSDQSSWPTPVYTPELSQSSIPTYITGPDQSAQTIPMETVELSQTSIPTHVTAPGQSSRPAPLSTPESNPPSFAALEVPPAESPPLISPDRSLDKLRPERGISRRAVVVGLGIVGLGTCGGLSAWAAAGGLQKTLRALGLLNVPTPTPTTPATPTTPPHREPSPQPDPSPRTSPPMGSLLQTYRGHSRALWTAAWSPDGKRIASGGDDGTVQVWDPVTGNHIFTYNGYLSRDQSPSVVTLSWSPDGKRIVSSATFSPGNGTFLPDVRVWDATTGNVLLTYSGHLPRTAGHSNVVGEVSWSPNGKYIASAGGYDKTVQVWDATSGQTIFTFRGHPDFVGRAKWSPDSTRVASGGNDGIVRVWDAATGNHLLTYDTRSTVVDDLAWNPDGTQIVTAARDGTIQVWSAATGNTIITYTGGEPVAWSPDGKRVVSGAVFLDHTMQVRDATTGSNAYIYHGYHNQVNVLAWSPDSTRIVLAGLDTIVQVWQGE
jgi:serine/threonine protein kinase/WD40 repeat protein